MRLLHRRIELGKEEFLCVSSLLGARGLKLELMAWGGAWDKFKRTPSNP